MNQTELISQSPHRRYNLLTGDWVLVSPQRSQRPWLGQVENTPRVDLPEYDPQCYLCPGNKRASGETNPAYTRTFSFTNDYSALLPDTKEGSEVNHPLFKLESERGLCRVVCFSPRHDLTLPEMSQAAIEQVVATWTRESVDLSRLEGIHYVQVFENKGAMMGCSNPHPHSQIWATGHVPTEPGRELLTQADYLTEHKSPMLLDYLAEEQHRAERIICSNVHFSVLVPFWAVWPFETLVVAHRPAARLEDLSAAEASALADVFKRITTRYDNLFEIAFPYSMGFHQAPNDGARHPEWVLHAHFYPPLLRSATIRKFMVGYEMLAMPQRDITPEAAATRLRETSEIHYRTRTAA
jgi:UDPglucose--hexose-1-phosphate uridylyltransferase